jgi:hypothetical protein
VLDLGVAEPRDELLVAVRQNAVLIQEKARLPNAERVPCAAIKKRPQTVS